MKNLIVLVGVLCVVAAIPVPEKPQSSLDLLQIPFGNNKVSYKPRISHPPCAIEHELNCQIEP